MALNISQLRFINKIQIIIHTGEGQPGINHMRYWIPEFMKYKVKACVLTRDINVFKTLSKEFTLLPICFATSPLEIEEAVTKISNLHTIFYTSNTANNIHLLRFIEYNHIFIGTENSDRDSAVTKFLRAYDELWVSSDAIIEKIKNEIDTRHLKLIKIGKPQLRELIVNSKTKKESDILYISSNEANNETENFSSLYILPSIVKELGNNRFNFDLKLDAKTGFRDKRLENIQKELQEVSYMHAISCVFHNDLTVDLLLKNKYIICDIKTLNSKILATNAIIFVYIPSDKSIENFSMNKYMEYDYLYSFSNVDELKKLMMKINDGNNEKQSNREIKLGYWLGTKETIENQLDINLKRLK